MRDGGRSSGAGRQGQASNHRKLRRSKAEVVSVAEKAGLDRAAKLAAIPAGESPASRRNPVTVVVISSDGEGD